MTRDAGKKLLAGAAEMLAIAKGDQPAARIHHNGHAYVPESELATLRARVEELERERKNLCAGLTARAKTLLRLRDALVQVHDHIEDEGDRVYFGSTNDAEILKDVWHELDGWAWDDIMEDGKVPDIYEASRKAHARAEAAEARLSEARRLAVEALEPFARPQNPQALPRDFDRARTAFDRLTNIMGESDGRRHSQDEEER